MRAPLLPALLCAAILAALFLLWPVPENSGPTASAPASASVTPELLAGEVEALRGLRFKVPLTFRRVPAAELERIVRAAMSAAVPPEEGARRLRTAFALGLIRPGLEFDAADCLAGSALELPAAHYDPATATLWINDAFSPATRPDLTARTVFHLAMALLQQQPDLAAALSGGETDDVMLTRRCLLVADATITAQRHTQQYAGREPSGVTVPETFTYHASPPFLRALLAFPAASMNFFHAPLRDKDPGTPAAAFLNAILARPPHSTAELLHPERYPAPPVPAMAFDRGKLPPLPVLTENTLGEFGIRTLFKTQLTSTEAEPGAAGWLADRYVVLTGAAPGQDHLLWRTRWATAEDASAFLRALASTHLGNAGMAPAPEHFPDPAHFRATTAQLTLLAEIGAEHTVTFASSPDPSLAQQLLNAP